MDDVGPEQPTLNMLFLQLDPGKRTWRRLMDQMYRKIGSITIL